MSLLNKVRALTKRVSNLETTQINVNVTAGLVPNQINAAEQNSYIIEQARTNIRLPDGVTFVETPVRYHVNNGWIMGSGTGIYCSEAAQFNDDNPLYALGSRLCSVNPDPAEDFLLLCGTKQKALDFAVYGRRWVNNSMPPSGPRCRSGIAVEGGETPPTGRSVVSDCLVADTDVGLATLATPFDNHADLLLPINVCASHCRAFFQSNNEQSVSHTFIHCLQESDAPMVGFELLRGGKIMALSFYQNGPFATIAAVDEDGAPNTNALNMIDYQWDHIDAVGAYFQPLDSNKTSMTGSIRGHINNPQFTFDYQDAGLLLNPGLEFNVANIE